MVARFCLANPDLVDVVADDHTLLIGRIKGFEGAAVSGTAEVEARPGRLTVRRASGGVDGSVVLRYHSVPCLRADPPVAWESVFLEDDPVPFIKMPAVDFPVTFTLGFPPVSPPRRIETGTPRRECDVSTDAYVPGVRSDFDRHFRRAVWIAVLITLIGGAMIYADKASDDRSAFVRWRPQVLQFWRGATSMTG